MLTQLPTIFKRRRARTPVTPLNQPASAAAAREPPPAPKQVPLAPLLDARGAQPYAEWPPPLQLSTQNINGSNEPPYPQFSNRPRREDADDCNVALLPTPPSQKMHTGQGPKALSAAREPTHAPGRGLQRGVPLQPLSLRPLPGHHLLSPPPAGSSPLQRPPAAGGSAAQQKPSPPAAPVLTLSSPWESNWGSPQQHKGAEGAQEVAAAACASTPKKRPSGLRRFAFNSCRQGGSPNRTSEQPRSDLPFRSNMMLDAQIIRRTTSALHRSCMLCAIVVLVE